MGNKEQKDILVSNYRNNRSKTILSKSKGYIWRSKSRHIK